MFIVPQKKQNNENLYENTKYKKVKVNLNCIKQTKSVAIISIGWISIFIQLHTICQKLYFPYQQWRNSCLLNQCKMSNTIFIVPNTSKICFTVTNINIKKIHVYHVWRLQQFVISVSNTRCQKISIYSTIYTYTWGQKSIFTYKI